MDDKNIYLASTAIELSEEEDKPYIELTNRLCYYGEPNLNNVVLPVDTAEEKAQTLINMPVQAKYKVGKNQSPDLGGHEMHKNKNGEVWFGTESVGVHTSVEVKDDTVEVNGKTKTLPCLFATSRIWKRNKNIINAIKELYNKGLLHSSWEIATHKFTFDNGVKTLTDYEFLGNALLGSTIPGAYPCAVALDMSSLEESENELAEAFTIDKEEETLTKKETEIAEGITEDVEAAIDTEVSEKSVDSEENTSTEVSESTKTVAENSENADVSSLTIRDLRSKLGDACYAKVPCYVAFVFPEDHIVWAEPYDRKSELEYIVFSYEVDGDVVTVGEPEKATLTVAINKINTTLAEKDDALIKANETISTLKAEISELQPFKDAAEKAALEKAEAEKAQKRENLKSYALKSKLISEAELDKEDETYNAEIAELIENIDEAGIKAVIANRFMEGLNTSEVEISEVKEETETSVSTDLNAEEEEVEPTINPIRAYLI